MGKREDDNVVSRIVPVEENESPQLTEVAEVLRHHRQDGILPDPARPYS